MDSMEPGDRMDAAIDAYRSGLVSLPEEIEYLDFDELIEVEQERWEHELLERQTVQQSFGEFDRD